MTVTHKKNIAILGSTGSIGTQALEVIRQNPERFAVEVLTAQNNVKLLIEQALEFEPNAIVIGNEKWIHEVKQALAHKPIKVYAGRKAFSQVVEMDSIDMVLTAMVGIAGLEPTMAAINSGKSIALANKETLVVAGNIITRLARQRGVNIYPVDSEHSAIFQCLAGEWDNPVEKIYLTASGGPFRGKDKEFLSTVKKEMALQHPTWDMGSKITIDSASLMNKGLEVIEAHWLFGIPASRIEVIVHPQSIIHSLVQFEDGSMKAQMGLPDMKLPIQYAMGYPERIHSAYPRFNFMDFPQLTFEKPDVKSFPNLELAYRALHQAGNMPCILNAANEVAVSAFLKDQAGFLEMSDIIAECMDRVPFVQDPSLDDYLHTDHETRLLAGSLVGKKSSII
ncbi:MAG: 1-deoxy-D-xylulose-5-phosphate reductoisomerase [Bacteroidales bacterium]